LDEESVQEILVHANKFEDNLCDNQTPTSSSLTFDPMFNKVCTVGSPDFFMCICPHRPNYPGCKEHMSDPDKPDCYENEHFESYVNILSGILEDLGTKALEDVNMNGLPDACENNGR
jgi:hypothetical protein